MKKVLKVFAIGFAALLLFIGGALAWLMTRPPRDFSATPRPAITASADPEVIARGEYVAHALAHCSACHGPADVVAKHRISPDKTSMPGGYTMNAGPFGKYYPANLGSDPDTGVGKVSDGDLARAIRHGVDREGRLAAMMKFSCAELADEDLTAVISYLRTLPATKNVVPRDEWGPLAMILMGSFDPRVSPPPKYVPPGGVSRERGEYIANGPGHCHGCHTALDPTAGMAQVGARFSGEPMPEPDPFDEKAEFVIPNLTPDLETGVMASWNEAAFVARFRAGRVYERECVRFGF